MAALPLTLVGDPGAPPEAVFLATRTAPPTAWLLDAADGTERWSHVVDWTAPINAKGHADARWTRLLRRPSGRDPLLVTLVKDGLWYSMGVFFFSLEGPIGSYHHPGVLRAVGIVEDAEDVDVLLVGGNSTARGVRDLVPFDTQHHCACAVLVDPFTVSGQGFPYTVGFESERDWPGMPRAAEKSYLVIPPIHPETAPGPVHSRIVMKDTHAIEMFLEDGRIFFLARDLRPLRITVKLDSPADSMLASGEGRSVPGLLIRDGVREIVDLTLSY
jgi:hypothetical protein